ncbi:hypothetical protein PACTADRAFT_50393 [Pachysolen tannophilus NRRL Y-2460]|uniref:Uncharacterized protein n=1 Tax=Pachysolen tannophilus NRRL Y-2460 TaxID=669874 RepID=A0A1E4TVE5_PACTA|nr:hypothetical protein PACTADRAFT_50393 [Pachysolen tannophilus NRRL Y-2460]
MDNSKTNRNQAYNYDFIMPPSFMNSSFENSAAASEQQQQQQQQDENENENENLKVICPQESVIINEEVQNEEPSDTQNTTVRLDLQSHNSNNNNIVDPTEFAFGPSSTSDLPLIQEYVQQQQQHESQSTLEAHPTRAVDLSLLETVSEEDLLILKKLLASAEMHKWRYISNKISKMRGKKMSTEFCRHKFHEFFGLPYKHDDHNQVQYLKNASTAFESAVKGSSEGLIGSSIPYLVNNDSNENQ